MAFKITSPTEGINIQTNFGPHPVTFADSVGILDLDELPGGMAAYFKQAGYTVEAVEADTDEGPADPADAPVAETTPAADADEEAPVEEAPVEEAPSDDTPAENPKPTRQRRATKKE